MPYVERNAPEIIYLSRVEYMNVVMSDPDILCSMKSSRQAFSRLLGRPILIKPPARDAR